jgi:hypothetical protein
MAASGPALPRGRSRYGLHLQIAAERDPPPGRGPAPAGSGRPSDHRSPGWSTYAREDERIPGGHGLGPSKTRLGQQRFREAMLGRFGESCAFTGPRPPGALEVAHLYLYSTTPEHDTRGGLLLRCDLHALVDRELPVPTTGRRASCDLLLRRCHTGVQMRRSPGRTSSTCPDQAYGVPACWCHSQVSADRGEEIK